MPPTLGQLMQERLQFHGWSNAEAARRLDLSPTHVGNLLRDIAPASKSGKPTRIPEATVDRIARVLGIPLSVARLSAGLAPPQKQAGEQLQHQRLIAFYDELPPAAREDVLIIIEALWRRHGPQAETVANVLPNKPQPGDHTQLHPASPIRHDAISELAIAADPIVSAKTKRRR